MNILNKLTIKHLKMNKKRTTVTIIGIILSTALMVGIGTLMSSFREYSYHEAVSSYGKQHITISNVEYKNYKYIENNVYVKDSYLVRDIGYSKLEKGKNDYKPYLFLKETNDSYFKAMTLVEGTYPKNSSELLISEHIITNGGVKLNIGDKITLNLGKRYGSPEIYDEFGNTTYDERKELVQKDPYVENEILETNETREFTIVGIIERPYDEPYSSPGYTVLTKIDENTIEDSAKTDVSIIYKNTSKIKDKTESIYEKVKSNDKDYSSKVDYNNALLSLYGQSEYENINSTMTSIMAIILGLISIGCAIVIYNSFAISVMERKKQFGLFSSIGATKNQIRKTVFFEALIVGLIGIPIGIFCGIFGIWVVLKITNALLAGMFSYQLEMALYPLFMIIPIIYMIVTILISAYLPARKASKISPIEAIRLNDDIKIKSKKVKTNRLVRKLFGIEGDLALKNIKRNKKKYRITILSLFISIVLFVSFSTFLEYGTNSSNDFFEVRDYDIVASIEVEDEKTTKENIEKIKNIDGIDDYTFTRILSSKITPSENMYTKETLEQIKKNNVYYETDENLYVGIIALDQKSYESYIKSLGLNIKDYEGDEFKPIIINYAKIRDYSAQSVTSFKVLNLDKNQKLKYTISNYDSENEKQFDIEASGYETTKIPKYLEEYINNIGLNLIVSDEIFDSINSKRKEIFGETMNVTYNAYISAKDHDKVATEIRKILGVTIDNNAVYDITEAMQQEKNLVTVIKIFLYGFITLVTLIGVTSVFNTINTSIALRRKEFAVLRSIGLTPKGFNKMIRFESLFYGLKALLYALPVSLGIVFLFHLSFGNIASYSDIMIPWTSIGIAIVGVFVITFVTMMYASKKIKKENILDAIREENI